MKNYIMEIRKKIGNMPLIAAGSAVIVENEKGELLLQKRKDNGLWGYAGGYIEYGETLEDAAARELYEETGIVATELKFFSNFSGEEMIYTYPNGDTVYVIEHLFVCKNYQGSLAPQKEEVEELKFVHWEDINDFSKITPMNQLGLKAYINLKKEK